MSTTHDRAERAAAFARVQALFEELADLDAAARDERLAQVRRDAPDDARELDRLFAAERDAPEFLEQPAGALDGSVVGRWRVVARLASGGMGDVYRVRRADADVPWDAALKVLRAGCSGAELARRFDGEGRMLAALNHPDIVSLLDLGALEDGRPYFVMELVDGMPIDRHCAHARLGLRDRLELFLRVCSAVRHAHQRLVLHCDLKPSNVLVTSEGHPKLLDFGIAELATAAAAARGWPTTPGYSSPEQVRGDPLTVAADVWSLGAVLHELLTGELPATPDANGAVATPSAVLAARGDAPTPLGPARDVARALRGDLDAILARALAVDSSERYASVDALASDLAAHLAGRPIRARTLPAWERATRALRRHRFAAVAVLFAAACLATLAAREIRAGRAEARLGWRAHAEAVQVTRLLEDLLHDAGRPGAQQSSADFERSLDAASARASADFGDSPETLGRLRIAFGALYLDLDRREKARAELEQALELAKSHVGFGKADIERAERMLERVASGAGDAH